MSTDFDFIFYLDYLAKTFVGSDGGSPSPIVLTLGDSYNCGVKFLLSNLGNYSEIQKQVRTIKANVGAVKAPPTSGKFSLQFTNGAHVGTSSLIDFAANAAGFTTGCAGAIDNTHAQLTMENVALVAPSCWTFNLSGMGLAEPVEIERVDNTLQPSSFVRVRPYQTDGRWVYEVRLIKSSLVFTGDFARVLPAAPSITTIDNGSPRLPGSSANTNEVQSAKIPFDFQGTYAFRFDYRTSRILGKEDDETKIEEALNGMYSDGIKRFSVTNPVAEEAYIEFIGPLAELDQPELVIDVKSFPPGVVRFLLDCDKEEFGEEMRMEDQITDVPFEIELSVVNDNQDPTDTDIPARKITFQTTCTLKADAIFDELAERQPHDWQQPPVAKTYVPVSPDQIIVGQQNFDVAFGDPDTLEYNFTHNLHTAAGWVSIRTNDSTGRVLASTEFTADLDPDFINISLANFPVENGLVITFLCAGPRAVFLAHHHSIAEIDGLQDQLDAFTSSIGDILDKLPFLNPTTSTPAEQAIDIVLPDRFRAFPGKFAAVPKSIDPPVPLRTGKLLPALHKAAVIDLDFYGAVPTLAAAKGKVYRHTGTRAVTLLGGGGHASPTVNTNDLVGCDGRLWYFVYQGQAGKNSYYATDMNFELFQMPINSAMLRVSQHVETHFEFLCQTLATDVTCQAVLKIDFGQPEAEASPSPTGLNIKDLLWNTTPALFQPIVISSLGVKGKFGFNVLRALDDTIAANAFNYGSVVAAGDGKPSSADFVARGQVVEFDIVDDVPDARGSIFLAMVSGAATIS